MLRVILLSVFFLVACNTETPHEPRDPSKLEKTGVRYRDKIYDRSQIQQQLDVEYANHQNPLTGKSEALLMDIYIPDDGGQVGDWYIVVVHGGGFVSGDKSQQTDLAMEFAQYGFTVFNINYRLTNAQIGVPYGGGDVMSAFSFIRGGNYGIDISKGTVFGESAGAISAMAATYVNVDSAASLTSGYSGVPDYCISFSGTLYADKPGTAIWDYTNEFEAGEPELFMFHSTQDWIVPFEFARITYMAAVNAGVETDNLKVEWPGHAVIDFGIGPVADHFTNVIFDKFMAASYTSL